MPPCTPLHARACYRLSLGTRLSSCSALQPTSLTDTTVPDHPMALLLLPCCWHAVFAFEGGAGSAAAAAAAAGAGATAGVDACA
eukprot:1158843-Pelagomonas_calceolata.AAC.8